MWITVNKTMYKYHFTKEFNQSLSYLEDTKAGEFLIKEDLESAEDKGLPWQCDGILL
jgi:hypothetical protein